MGVGMPEELAEYVARGIDMMDCVLPSRNARNGCLFTSRGRVIIKQACYKDDARRSTTIAIATPAGITRAPTSGTCSRPARSSMRCWGRFTMSDITLTSCAGSGNLF